MKQFKHIVGWDKQVFIESLLCADAQTASETVKSDAPILAWLYKLEGKGGARLLIIYAK